MKGQERKSIYTAPFILPAKAWEYVCVCVSVCVHSSNKNALQLYQIQYGIYFSHVLPTNYGLARKSFLCATRYNHVTSTLNTGIKAGIKQLS